MKSNYISTRVLAGGGVISLFLDAERPHGERFVAGLGGPNWVMVTSLPQTRCFLYNIVVLL